MTSIRLPVEVDAGLGRIRTEPERSAYIRSLLRQVLLTAPGERINRPDFGCGVRRMMFAPNNPATTTLAEVLVHEALTTWLADVVEVLDIEVVAEATTLRLTVTYRERVTGRSGVLREVLG